MPTLTSLGLASPLAFDAYRPQVRPVFPTQAQEHSNWCWAAVTSALLAHFRKPAMSQCSLVTAWKNRNSCPPAPPIDLPASMDVILNNLVGVPASWNGPDFFFDPSRAFAAISASIDDRKPVPLTIAWYGTGAFHCVCAFGYTTVGGEPALWIFDPWPAWSGDGNVRLRTVSSMRNYDQAPGTGASVGYWAEAYFIGAVPS